MVNPYLPREGKQPVKEAHRDMGRGMWRKRTLLCNGGDRD
jgi:hypothetical protein